MDTRQLLVALSTTLLSLGVCAAEPAAANKAPATNTKAAAKPAPKVAHKVAHKAPRQVKAPVVESAPATVEADPLNDESKLAVAQQVHTGRIACELGNTVTVTPDANRVGGFVVHMASHVFHMSPVNSSTGAVRLEDTQHGAMWLQLGNKSMLMSTKLGQRLADECQSPAQLAVAEKLKHNPPPSLLDDTPGLARK